MEQALEYRERLIETLCDVDDAVMDAYLRGGAGRRVVRTAHKKGVILA
jgi:dihydroorotase